MTTFDHYDFSGIFSDNFSSENNFSSTLSTTVLSLFPTVPSIHNVSDASFVLYHHRAFGSPVLSTFLKAIRAGYLASIPRLTATIVLRNPPLSLATSFGHMDACRKGLHSTRLSFPPSLLALTRAQHRATLTPQPNLITTIPLHVPPPTIASPPCVPTIGPSPHHYPTYLFPPPSTSALPCMRTSPTGRSGWRQTSQAGTLFPLA